MTREDLLSKLHADYNRLEAAQDEVRYVREKFSRACREAHEQGISDQEIANLTDGGYSRARIQQFRAGERKPVNA